MTPQAKDLHGFFITLRNCTAMIQLHNKMINSIALQTAPGCMGECGHYRMLAFRNGALKFTGFANIKPIGENYGAINYFQFDHIAAVVETSGFLELPDKEDGGIKSSVGNTILEIGFSDDSSRIITRDGLVQPPIFWAVERLMGSLLDLVEWGRKEYDDTIEQFTAEYGHSSLARLTRGLPPYGESFAVPPDEAAKAVELAEAKEGSAFFVKAMIQEAIERKCSMVRLTPSKDALVVDFYIEGEWTERDRIPIRFWHLSIASIHSLCGKGMINLEPKTASALNKVEMSHSSPRNVGRRGVSTAVRLDFAFSQEIVTIKLSPRI